MSRYAIINKTGLVDNLCLWDGKAEWSPPEGFTAVLLADDSPVGVGDVIDSKGNVKTVAPPDTTPDPAVLAALEVLASKADPTRPDPTQEQVIDAMGTLANVAIT